MPAVVKRLRSTDGRHQRRGRQRTNPRHRRQFLADRMRPGHALHPVRHPLDARVELRQLRVQLGEGVAGKGGQSRRRVIQETG